MPYVVRCTLYVVRCTLFTISSFLHFMVDNKSSYSSSAYRLPLLCNSYVNSLFQPFNRTTVYNRSTINHQPSTINHQPSTITHHPSHFTRKVPCYSYEPTLPTGPLLDCSSVHTDHLPIGTCESTSDQLLHFPLAFPFTCHNTSPSHQ